MQKDTNRGDLEYGYPSFVRGTKYSLSTKCSYLEILAYAGSTGTAIHTSTGVLDDTSIDEWMYKDVSEREAGLERTNETFAGGLRLLLGECGFDSENKYCVIPFTEEKFNAVSEHLQLPAQFIPSMITTLTRSYKFSCSPSLSSIFKPATCFVYGVAVFEIGHYHISLSYSPSQKLTYAFLLFRPRYDLPSPYSTIIQNLSLRPSLAIYPLFLPILFTELSIESSAPRIRSASTRLDHLERAAGQYEWADIMQGDPLSLDFESASKQLNFTSRWLGMEIWRCKSNLLVLDNFKSEIDLLSENGDSRDVKGRELKELIDYHANTCHNLILRAEFQEKRLQTQIAVVYQFMVQKDSKVNLELAETTTVIARESKKDSSAMKAIAVLTMCFLPGTFLAALFAMPFFNWQQDDRPIIKDGFRYYWAIAIPLMLLVLGMWAACMLLPWRRWMHGVKKERKGSDVESGN